MRKIKIGLYFVPVLAVLTLSKGSYAQDITYERDYKRAVALYKTGDYALAMNDLIPLTSRKYQHGLVPFAHYYYALAAQKNKQLTESRQMLLQLRERFPDWRKMDDVNYLLADLAFREKRFGEALDYLGEITNGSVKKDAEGLKRFYVSQLQDLAYLKNLNRQYPSDKIVASTLINLIQKTSNDKSDLELSDELTNRFGVTPVKSTTAIPERKNTNNLQKGYYNVAVVLPFRLKEFMGNQRIRSNQFAFDMYEGMKMAKTKLQQEGIIVNMFTYDVGSEPEEMLDIVNNTNFAQTDLIMGPVYNEPAQLAADFAETNQIFFVHPTTLSNDILTNHPNTLMFHPSFDQQATQGFEYMKSLPANTTRKIAIYYGLARRDSTLAAAYKTKATEAGYQIIDFRKTNENLDISTTLNESNKIGHVAVFSTTETDGNKIMAMLTKKRVDVPVLATASCFNMAEIQSSSLSEKNLYLLDTEFIDTSKPQVRNFQIQYLSKRNTIPSLYALQGYDALLFFGRMLHQYRDKLRNGLNTRSYDDDYLLSGFNYQQSNENQIVPILQMNDMRWVRVK